MFQNISQIVKKLRKMRLPKVLATQAKSEG